MFQFLADLNDVRLENYPLIYDEGRWIVNNKKMADKISGNTRAICLVNPNNPTGSYIKSDELAAINGLCKKHDLAIITDEVFLDYILEKNYRPVSLAANDKNLTFVLGGLSKVLGLPQMKFSWIVVNGPGAKTKKAVERLEVIADTYLSINTPVQNAAPVWLNLQDVLQEQIKERTRRNRDYLLQNLPRKAGPQCLHAEGGWYAILKLPDWVEEEVFTLKLLEEAQVYIHPGYFFDFAKGSYAVVSLLAPESAFQEGIRRLVLRII